MVGSNPRTANALNTAVFDIVNCNLNVNTSKINTINLKSKQKLAIYPQIIVYTFGATHYTFVVVWKPSVGR